MQRITKTLSLDSKALERGERYSERHATSLSQLVSDFLSRLPLDEEEQELPPVVRRLLGAASGRTDEEDYREYLFEKYGR
ncbi:MAG TPA: DUF6364 family protein [Longimicrobiaceae bacterium]|nr:DUF6364 family protein [Longimicrobiaceae bacterium]